jgi:pimeloyl-ACP methyl ester carboxylesterase
VAHRRLAILTATGILGLAACSAGGHYGRGDDMQMMHTLLAHTRNGVVSPLDEEHFSHRAAREGVWHPLIFTARANPGIHFIEPYDPNRRPVLFVHGYGGSPRDFSYLIARLDTTRFQAWVYNYPSGLRLPQLAAHLEWSVSQVRIRFQFDCLSIVAHSMGGLVVRGFMQRHASSAEIQCVPIFVSISTPWEGSRAARWAPDLVSTWRDIARGSPYLQRLFAMPLPDGTRYALMFTSDDRTVPIASQLRSSARQEAAEIIGYAATHAGILRDAAAAAALLSLLEKSHDELSVVPHVRQNVSASPERGRPLQWRDDPSPVE